MAGSSRNSDRRNDNSYPPAAKPKPRTLRERAAETFDAISTALNPRTYAEKPAQRTMQQANESSGGGARTRRIDAQLEEATGEARRRSSAAPRRSR